MRGGMLKFWILKLLSSQPMNGTEIIREMEKRSGGHWRPSPGSIYPALASLERNDLVEKNEDGRYEMTDKGKETRDGMNDILENFNDREEEDDIIQGTAGNLRYLIEGLRSGLVTKSQLGNLVDECRKLLEEYNNGK